MTKKPFLVLQLRPEDEAADNELAAFLRVGGLKKDEIVRIRAEKKSLTELTLGDFSAVIVGGSPFDVSKPESEKSALQKRIEREFSDLFDEVVKRDIPFLGACSGGGLLGKYLGASVSSKYAEDVGGVDVFVTDEGKADPLLADFPNKFRALAGHKEACDDTPPGAVLLASSKTCPVQMFRVGENVYATQFHPEADGEVFKVRINIYKHHGYFSPSDCESLIAAVRNEKTPQAKEILRRFVARYR